MIRRFLSLIGGVAIGLSVSQFPEYAQQYAQRLGGAVDELAVITQRFDAAASNAGLSRPEAFERYRSVGDDFVAGQGADMEATFVRYEKLSNQLQAIESASATERLMNFTTYFDQDIANRALDAYQPAVPVTAEGLVYAVGGTLVGFGAVSLITAPFGRRSRRRKGAPTVSH